MADALISPAVSGALWVATGGLTAYAARRVQAAPQERLVPLMGVLGAFVFAAQMINFAIPYTGSSGHLGGGLLLAILLGPAAAFLVMASVLTVQAFFFQDGGLLALGCNIFNLGFFPAFVAYPLIYRVAAGARADTPRAWLAAVAAAVVGLQLGAAGVVLETKASGITALPLGAFLLTLSSIHLAIGAVEGLATAAVVAFIARTRPGALPLTLAGAPPGYRRTVLFGGALATLLLGGVVSWFASTHPDGLEWTLARIAGAAPAAAPATATHQRLAAWQQKTALLPSYQFNAGPADAEPPTSPAWPAVSAGTSTAGLVGGLITVGLVSLVGLALHRPWRPRTPPPEIQVS